MFKLAFIAVLTVVLFQAYASSQESTPIARAADSVEKTWDKASVVGAKAIKTVDQVSTQLSEKKTVAFE